MEYALEDPEMPIELVEVKGLNVCIKDKVISDSESDNNDDSEDDEVEEGTADKKSTKKRCKRTTSKLSASLKGLMGEANLRYARGDMEMAKKMCYEVIRQAPDAYEPFLTLSQMYENTNVKKYRGYLMLAGHLYPQNVSIWCRLAEVNIQEGFIMEAVSCYSKAINVEPRNIELHKKRLELLEQKGDSRMTLTCQTRMAKKMPRKQYEIVIKICMDVAKQHFEQKNYIRAIEALDIPFKRFPDKVTQDLLNMMLELMLLSHKYTQCLDYFTQYCGFTFELFVRDDNQLLVNSYVIPENLQVDLKMKFITCLIRLKSDHLIGTLIDSVLVQDDVEDVGDLYLDVVEALMSCNYSQEALKLLVPLVKSKNFSLAAVWLKYAECLNYCEMYEQSIEAYFTVMALAPQHVEVLYPLAMLLLKQNKKQEALEVLSQDISSNKIDVAVLIEQMKLLKQIGDWDSYFKCAELLLSRHCVVLKYPVEMKIVTTKETVREKITKIRRMREFRQDIGEVETNFISIKEPTIEEEYKVYKDILQQAKEQKRYNTLQKFAFMGLCSKRFLKYFDEIYMLTFLGCIYNRDYFHGYTIIREILVHHFRNNSAWNWFTLIMQTPEDVRHSRFLDRYQEKFSAPGMIDANYNVSVGNYMPGLAFFMKDYKQNRTSYAAFMIGVVMLHLYCQKNLDKSKKKSMAELVTYLFLNYSQRRSKHAKHETLYNLGRMYHQLGVAYLAEFYYKKVLKFDNDIVDKYPNILCLKREAAFNLHVIYRNTGNFIAARNIIMEHIVI